MQELARWPVIAREPQATAWLADVVRRGLAPNTVVAYARGVSEYLERCHHQGVDPLVATRAQLLEAKDHLQRMVATIPLTEDEQTAVEEGAAAVNRLLARLADLPTPAGPTPRQLGRLSLPVTS